MQANSLCMCIYVCKIRNRNRWCALKSRILAFSLYSTGIFFLSGVCVCLNETIRLKAMEIMICYENNKPQALNNELCVFWSLCCWFFFSPSISLSFALFPCCWWFFTTTLPLKINEEKKKEPSESQWFSLKPIDPMHAQWKYDTYSMHFCLDKKIKSELRQTNKI